MNDGPMSGPDVVIRRCTVEVVRRGGWSWGPDPDLLTRRVLGALPDLLARELDGLPDGDEDVEITEPVLLHVRVRLPELLAGRPVQATSDPGPDGRLADVAVRMATGTARMRSPRFLTAGEAAPAGADRGAEQPSVPPPPPASLLGFVAELATRQELAALLDLLPPPTRDGVATGLAAAVGDADPEGLLPALLLTLAERGELEALLELLPTPTLGTWRELARTVAVSTAAQHDVAVDVPVGGALAVTATLDALLARRLAQDPDARTVRSGDPVAPGTERRGTAVPSAADGSPEAGPRSPAAECVLPAPALLPGNGLRPAGRGARGSVEVESVLPFLVAGALARLGVLDAVAPALAATGRGDAQVVGDAQLFAAALAYTVLQPLHRGWSRTPEARVAAAAFADLEDVPDEALTGFFRRGADAAPVLGAVVALALCRGHVAGCPLLLAEVSERAGGGLVLADPEGLFPIGWSDEPDLVVRHWSACGRPVVLLGAAPGPDPMLGPVATEAIRQLSASGMRFTTDLPPARGENWRRLPGRSLWVSPDLPGPAGPELMGHLQLLPARLERLDDLVRALAVSRRAAPRASLTGLARTLPVVAALALGTLGWLLWKEREPTDPLLALERLADLSGVIRYGRDEVAVLVPLGRRHTDLLRHGLLADVHDVPWLRGRTLTFTGG